MEKIIEVLKMANERKNALRREFLEKIRLTVLERGIMEIVLRQGGVTEADIANEFKTFQVKNVAGKTFIAKMKDSMG